MGERIAAMKLSSCLVVALCLGAAFGEVYFEESFGDGWESRWVTAGKEGLGEFKASAGKFGDDVGLQTSQDAKFYGISAALPTFSNKDKTLIVQYTVKHEQNIDCGGAYLKLGPAPFDGKEFNGDTEYNIMFGPDICGMTKRTHLIFNYNKENLLKTKDLRTESNELTHLYTLTVKPDNTFDVSIDGVSVEAGSLAEGWKFLKEKEVDDPEDKKPEDWDDESDGEWEAPQIDNPDFKGAWSAKRIANPAYKGVWAPKKIANPEYVDDDTLYSYDSFAYVGIDVWQVKSGTIFDNILITDDVAVATAAAEKIKAAQDVEKAAKKDADDKKAEEDAAAAKRAEEDAKKAEEDAKKAAEEPAAEETPAEEAAAEETPAEEPAAEETKKEEL